MKDEDEHDSKTLLRRKEANIWRFETHCNPSNPARGTITLESMKRHKNDEKIEIEACSFNPSHHLTKTYWEVSLFYPCQSKDLRL